MGPIVDLERFLLYSRAPTENADPSFLWGGGAELIFLLMRRNIIVDLVQGRNQKLRNWKHKIKIVCIDVVGKEYDHERNWTRQNGWIK